ncbi:MAG TPA: iron-containing alcohol dehydrogenase [Anaerolineae bacterium]
MRFEFATANRIVFGPGSIAEAGKVIATFGNRALVLTGASGARSSVLLEKLAAANITATLLPVTGEPTVEGVKQGAERAVGDQCDVIVGFGGGSAIDSAKAIAALAANGGEPLDYLEVIGKGKPLTKTSLPCVAIPTTAGTGAEVTRNAVLMSLEHKVKVSLRSASMLPRAAIVDPELTLSLPLAVTASTGMDALAQLIEPFVSIKANPITDSFCREGMRRAARSLQRTYEHGDDRTAREDMACASLFGGLALANSGLGAVHGFAGPIGGLFPIPHGAVCACLLPIVMEVNLHALRERQPDSHILQKYDEIAQILTANPNATSQDGVNWVQELCSALRIQPLRAFGIDDKSVPELIEKSAVASSMQANPLKLTYDELREILMRAL